MRPSLLLIAALGLALPTAPPAHAQGPAYHLQLQVNSTMGLGGGSCRVSTGVIGTYPDSAGRLAIGTPVDLVIPCAAAGASFFDARLAGRPGAFQPAGPDALRPLATPVPLPAATPAAPSLAPPPPQPQQVLQPQPRQVLIAPTAPTTRTAPPAAPRWQTPQPMQPLPAMPVAPSRPLVIQGAAPPVTAAPVTAPPGPAFTPPPSPSFGTPTPLQPVQGGDTATMRPDAAIVLNFGPASAARTGTSQRVVLPTDPGYPALLTQLGGIVPGQTKPLPR